MGARRFVAHLRDDRLALGEPAAPSIRRDVDRFVESHGNAGRLLARRPPGLPDRPFLKRVCRGGLPGAYLVIALIDRIQGLSSADEFARIGACEVDFISTSCYFVKLKSCLF
jgi:hypothetical protein